MRHLIVGTAGHIDHGKSALVKALTGTDPDRLKEEKLRGITIDLGFAHLDLGDVSIGFVDVPGHERFVKNMLAGVGGIDFVLLVIAADESVMPQTREHFDICRLLGVRSGIVAITKTDLADEDMIEVVRDEIRELVRDSFLSDAPILDVSSKSGSGIEVLKGALREKALSTPSRPAGRLLRLPIDRVFSMRGFGTVVTGTLTSGEIHKDEEAELIPSGIKARVRGIQVYGQSSEIAMAGQRTAVNLQGVDLSTIERGMVLTVPGLFHATQMIDVRIDLLATAKPLKNFSKVRFHHGTSEVLARVALMGADAVAPGRSAYAQLRLDSRAFCLSGDPFILRQFSPMVTIGGGRVLHPQPVKHRTTDKAVITEMRRLESPELSERISAFVASCEGRAMDLKTLNSLLGMREETLRSSCSSLSRAQQVVQVEGPTPILILPHIAGSLEAETLTVVSKFHDLNPLVRGISREELRERVYRDLPLEVFRHFLNRLVEGKKIRVQDEFVSLYGREIQLSERGQALREELEARFRDAGFQPPGIEQLTSMIEDDPAEVRRVYFWMLREKLLVKVSEDLTYHRATIAEITKTIRESLPAGSRFGVAEFKELFGLTRKHAIPLLEYLDRERITRRQGNERILL